MAYNILISILFEWFLFDTAKENRVNIEVSSCRMDISDKMWNNDSSTFFESKILRLIASFEKKFIFIKKSEY